MSKKTPREIFMQAMARMRTARFGLEDMRSRPERMRSGLHNVIVFGRMVTWTLQNLRNGVTGFDEWYGEKVQYLKSDPVMKYFSDLRPIVEHEAGSPPLDRRIKIHRMTLEDLGPAPPGAIGFFIIDGEGGSGRNVSLSDGRQEKYYVQLPVGSISDMAHLPDAPSLPDLAHPSAIDMAARFLDSLDKILRDACEKIPELKGCYPK